MSKPELSGLRQSTLLKARRAIGGLVVVFGLIAAVGAYRKFGPAQYSATSAVSAGENQSVPYNRYCNGRFGFCVNYPADFKPIDPPPDNNDGRKFGNKSGVLITVFGGNNVLDHSPADEIKFLQENFDVITYRARGKDWFVMSGSKGSDILYIKTYIGVGGMNEVWIQYPQSDSKRMAPIVEAVSKSLTHGPLEQAD